MGADTYVCSTARDMISKNRPKEMDIEVEEVRTFPACMEILLRPSGNLIRSSVPRRDFICASGKIRKMARSCHHEMY